MADSGDSIVATLPDRSRAVWWTLALAVATVFLAIVVRYLGIVAFGLFLYYVGRPVSRRLETIVGTAGRAAALTIVAILLPLLAVIWAVTAVAIGQLLALAGGDVGRLLEVAEPTLGLETIPESPSELFTIVGDELKPRDATTLLDIGTGVLAQIGGLVFVTTLLFAFVYLLLRYERTVADWVHENVLGSETAGATYLRGVDRELGRIYGGQMLTILVVVVLAWVLYTGLNVVAPAGVSIPFPLLLALVTGVASFVPLIGRSLVYVPLVAYLAILALRIDSRLLWFPAATGLAGVLVLDPTVRYGIRPYLSSHGTPSSVMLLSYVLGSAIFGWYGVFLAPIAVVSIRQFLRSIFPALVRGEPVRPVDDERTSDESSDESELDADAPTDGGDGRPTTPAEDDASTLE
ncbi:AI-2E family transporter [Natribaculum luteum]|uniref:AI-2E family transporter n=1 Tax=Natribaculum luteum TaxID=1586232 RepID=A0ABD5P4K9_9EURY|nr:AI-2E family transporter [Natribaculum luteum]